MIDTLTASRKLESSGILSKHAEAITTAISNQENQEIKLIKNDIEKLDDKIDKLDNKVEHKFDKLDSEIKELNNKLDNKFDKQFKWTISLISIMTGILATIMTLLKFLS